MSNFSRSHVVDVRTCQLSFRIKIHYLVRIFNQIIFGYILLPLLAFFINPAHGYTDTAKFVASGPNSDFYIYTGSIKKNINNVTGDYSATAVINYKNSVNGTGSRFRNYTFHCADKSAKEITLHIDVGHVEPWAKGAQTFNTSVLVGKKSQSNTGTINEAMFNFVCSNDQSAKAPLATAKDPEPQSDYDVQMEKVRKLQEALVPLMDYAAGHIDCNKYNQAKQTCAPAANFEGCMSRLGVGNSMARAKCAPMFSPSGW